VETKLLQEREDLFDHFVASRPTGDVLQTTKWGRLKVASGWDYWPLAVMDKGQIQAAALILTKNLPVGGKAGYSPRGPLFTSPEALETLLAAGSEFLKEQRALVWKMDPPLPDGDPVWRECVRRLGLRFIDTGPDFGGVQPRYVMTLDLNSSPDTLLKNMKSKTRYNIRYAQRKGVQVVKVRERQLLNVFYCLLQETAARDRFTIRPLEYYEAMWDQLMENGLAQLFLAYHEGTALGRGHLLPPAPQGVVCLRSFQQ
jgi:peptidoglycan pentaglycine glycine transferase (the first glycine)